VTGQSFGEKASSGEPRQWAGFDYLGAGSPIDVDDQSLPTSMHFELHRLSGDVSYSSTSPSQYSVAPETRNWHRKSDPAVPYISAGRQRRADLVLVQLARRSRRSEASHSSSFPATFVAVYIIPQLVHSIPQNQWLRSSHSSRLAGRQVGARRLACLRASNRIDWTGTDRTAKSSLAAPRPSTQKLPRPQPHLPSLGAPPRSSPRYPPSTEGGKHGPSCSARLLLRCWFGACRSRSVSSMCTGPTRSSTGRASRRSRSRRRFKPVCCT
jgi:hypothetical protein